MIRIIDSVSDTPSTLTTVSTMEMNTEVTFEVTFDDGTLVTETLQVLHAEVASVLDSFKLEFER